MPTQTTYEIPTWNQIYEMLLNQTEKIQKNNYKPDTIIAISRGGLIPARILSDLLETPQIATIKIEFYTGINQTTKQPTLTQTLTTPVNNKKTLIVDDITDTGKTLKLAKEYIHTQGAKETKTATIYTKPASTTTPDYSEKQTCCWVVFPWDTKEIIRKIIQKQNSKRAINQEINKLTKAGLPIKLAQKFLFEMLQEQNHAATH